MTNAIPQQVLEFLKSSSPFDLLDSESLIELCQRIKVIYLTCENSEALFQDLGRQLYLIASGEFTITDGAMDQSEAIRHLSSGDYFGYSALLEDRDHNLSASSTNPGLVYCISAKDFDACCDKAASFEHFFSRMHKRELYRRKSSEQLADTESMWLHTGLTRFCQNPPIQAQKDLSILNAAQLMNSEKISSLLITDPITNQLMGLVTDRDMRQRVVAKAIDLEQPIAGVMTSPAIAIDQQATVFDALMLMSRHNIHHLPVTADGTPAGLLTANDLIRQQQSSLLFLVGAINKADTLPTLIEISKEIPDYLSRHASRLGDYDIASHFLTQTADLITEKLYQLFVAQQGQAPCDFAWISYGSQARGELLPSSDQDNGLLLERTVTEQENHYFQEMANFITQNLALCGQKLCPGNVMASNPKLRLTPQQAIKESQHWVDTPTPKAVMNICIYLDMRLVFGKRHLYEQVQQARQQQVRSDRFLAALAINAQDCQPPISLFQRFVYESGLEYKDGINLKAGAIAVINSIARLYAFYEGIEAVNTLERLKTLTNQSGLSESDRHNLRDIWQLLQRLRWRHQLDRGLHNSAIKASDLSPIEQHQLKAAFKAIRDTQEALLIKFAPGTSL